MRISARMLKNVVDVNHWQHSNQAYIAEGQPNDFYIQIIDLDWSTKISPEQSAAFPQFPIRYISLADDIAVVASFLDIDSDEEFQVSATQAFPQDRSIWKFTLTSDQIPNAGNVRITVTEDAIEKSFIVQNAISVELLNRGGC